MKFQYLGTAAAEAIPALFCGCPNCVKSREIGGRAIRTRSQAIIDDTLLIDLPCDTYSHFLTNGIQGHKIRHLLITHSHPDHLYPTELLRRKPPYAHNMECEQLKVYCTEGAYKTIREKVKDNTCLQVHCIKPFEQLQLGPYQVCPLPARHAIGDDAVIYLIQGEKTLLYAHDTGYFYDEVFDYLEKNHIHLDLISLDCTNVDLPISNSQTHMGVPNILDAVQRLTDIGAVDQRTVKFINHFSHNANPLHHVLEERVSPLGYHVAYDGLAVIF
jgi:phosphoribosyl 1,2-cyclic phosphate phosphodiesterase